jgi:hypothetical protein
MIGHIGSNILTRWFRYWACTISITSVLELFSASAIAQGSPQLYIYPRKNQSSQQEDRDRYECHTWAAEQTGYDPSRAYPSNPAYLDPQPYQPS